MVGSEPKMTGRKSKRLARRSACLLLNGIVVDSTSPTVSTCFAPAKKQVGEHNKKRLLAQEAPIALIEAKHKNNDATSRKPSDLFWGLETKHLFLCVGAHISLTINLFAAKKIW
jgi:hypothetical protein